MKTEVIVWKLPQPKKNKLMLEPDFDKEPSAFGTWVMVLCFGLPWVLGVGVIGIFLIELFD